MVLHDGADEIIRQENDQRTELFIQELFDYVSAFFQEKGISRLAKVFSVQAPPPLFSGQNVNEVIAGRPEAGLEVFDEAVVFHEQQVVELEFFEHPAVGDVVVEVDHGLCVFGWLGKYKIIKKERII